MFATDLDRPLADTLLWADDPFFRPTIGAFAGSMLVATAPTRRRRLIRLDGRADWVCGFDRASFQETGLPLSELLLVCLETGELLPRWEFGAGPLYGAEREAADIDDLIALGRHRRTPWDASGFRTFLKLPTVDQVQLLFVDLLGREAETGAVNAYVRRLHAGVDTVLDVRDSILRSNEFRERHISLHDRVGNWIVWGGLKCGAPHVLIGTHDTGASGGESPSTCAFGNLLSGRSTADALGAHLARMALGAEAAVADVAQWLEDHEGAIAAMASEGAPATAAPARSGSEAVAQADGAPVLFGGILPSMRPEGSGRRFGSTVKVLAGHPGRFLSGPYMRLASGRYDLVVLGAGTSASAPDGMPDSFGLEVTYADAVVARRSFPVERLRAEGRCHLGFVLTPEIATLLCEARYEFRIWSDGASDIEITGIELRRLGRRVAEAPANRIDWRGTLAVGSAGEIKSPGAIDSVPGRIGHVFYGPYTRMLPGDHVLRIEAVADRASEPGERVLVDVITAVERPIAETRFEFEGGRAVLTVPFTIPPAADLDDLSGQVEFRLWTEGAPNLRIAAVATAALHEGTSALPFADMAGCRVVRLKAPSEEKRKPPRGRRWRSGLRFARRFMGWV